MVREAIAAGAGTGHPRVLAAALLAAVLAVVPALASDCAVEVRVRTASGVAPPPGALAVWRGGSGGQSATPIDAEGAAVLGNLPCGPASVAVAQRLGDVGRPQYRRWSEVSIRLATGATARVDLTMPDLYGVAFRALDTNDRPASLGTASVFPVSDADGVRPDSVFLQLDHLGVGTALLERGRYSVSYSRDETPMLLAVEIDGVPAGEQPAIVDVPGPREIVFRVAPSYRIEGAIRDAEGAGVDGVFLEPEGEWAPWTPFRWPVRDDGTFVVEAAELPAVLRPVDHDGRWRFEPESITVDDPERLSGWFFLARPDENGRLTGTIVGGREREPITGATLVPFPLCDGPDAGVPPRGRPLKTDSSGRFDVACREGCRVGLRIEPPDDTSWVSRTWGSESGACGTDVEIVLDEGGTVSGTIRGPGRKPLEGIRVSVGKGRFGVVRTGPDGKYRMPGVPPGRHTVNPWLRDVPGISDPVGVPVDPQAFDENGLLPVVVLAKPGDRVRQDFDVIPGGRICVRVTDEAGERLEIERLSAFRSGEEEAYRTQYGYAADRREEPDRLCARRIPPGRVLVRVGSRSFIDVWWPGEEDRALATEVELEAGKTVEIGPMIARPAGAVKLALPERVDRDATIVVELSPAHAPDGAGTDAPTAPGRNVDDTPAASEDAVEWTPLPRQRVRPRRDPHDDGGDGSWSYRKVRIVDVPEGTWWLRFCVGKNRCEGGDDFCSSGPVTVERGETSLSEAVSLADSRCPVHEPE